MVQRWQVKVTDGCRLSIPWTNLKISLFCDLWCIGKTGLLVNKDGQCAKHCDKQIKRFGAVLSSWSTAPNVGTLEDCHNQCLVRVRRLLSCLSIHSVVRHWPGERSMLLWYWREIGWVYIFVIQLRSFSYVWMSSKQTFFFSRIEFWFLASILPLLNSLLQLVFTKMMPR